MLVYKVIEKAIITEKSTREFAEKKYTFSVSIKSNKIEIKKAIEQLFGVKVEKVTTCNYLGKKKRVGNNYGTKKRWKKAIVKLKKESEPLRLFDEAIS